MTVITSHRNQAYRDLLAAKKDRGMMLLEGRRLVEDARSRGMVPSLAALTDRYRRSHGPAEFPYILLSEDLFARLADTKTPQGILAFFPAPWASVEEIARRERIVVLDGLQDPGNVGTIIRTAEAFGFSAVAVTEGTASPFSPKAVRSSMGSVLGVAIARIQPGELAEFPHRLIALAPEGSTRLSAGLFREPFAVCLGQEGAGVSPEMLALSHQTVSIPMKGKVESLNVAVAAGIVLACAAGALDG
ncbi:MAG: TrmH family RNA methyltransferase [Desulfomonilia bacterium]|nr:RNA methyltransferase [Pseudomonadota bacterium]HPD22149.1 RNA methyltransferase [Deltaproteobacteria bacterium]HPX17861.1 RNA methyltransferase [Deltaproteobacteria bacterium]HRS55976.1 RNA methyltransferase [Desulfomonilia bacterium]HRV35598.1 RNA methyltransferase [Desulfomonilia bacterium]